MSKATPLIILIIMVGMLLISWNNVLKYNSNIKAEYNEHILAAEAYMEKEIYIDAVKEYEAALSLDSHNYELSLKIVDLYKKLGIEASYVKACEMAIAADASQVQPYIWIADYYINKYEYKRAYAILQDAKSNISDDSQISDRLITIMGKYDLATLSYDDFKGWIYENGKNTGYSYVSKEGLKGLLSSSNKISVECEYEDIGPYMNELIPVKSNGEYFYITIDGYRKLVTDTEAEYLGAFNDGFGVAKIDGYYGYVDKKAKEYHFEYEGATPFYNGIAAVKKNNKWGIINTSFNQITEYCFDEILMDEYGFISTYGVFFAKQGEKYYLYNANGECLSDGFDNAKLFVSDEPAAVELNGKWGFVSKSGELVIEPTYADADSFSLGYAPYFDKEKWGCIDEKGNILIEPTFDVMKSFTRNGYSLVEENGIQKFAVISIYE